MSGFEVIIPYLVAAGAAVSAVAAVDQADTTRKAQHTNADIKAQAAEEQSRQATQQIESQRTRARSVIGQQLASTSESGAGLSGSNLDLLNQSLTNNELDSLSIRHGSELNRSGLNSQAAMDRFSGDSAQTGGYLSAAGSLLNSAGRTYTQQGQMLPRR